MKRLFPLINIFLITAISYLGVDAIYKIFTTQFETVGWPKPVISKNSFNPAEIKTSPLSEYSPIIERDIFQTRTAGGVADVEKIVVENIKQTERNLMLWGTVIGNDPAESYAIIEEPGVKLRRRKQFLHKTGDVVQGATIKKILREKIILSANGKNEILNIVKPQSSRKITRTRQTSNQRRRQPTRQRRTLRSSQIQKAISNIDSQMSQVNFRPHSEGFRITRIQPSSIFRRMGLRRGDIITAVDERAITSVNDALDIWQSLTARGEASLKIKRRGRERIIDYQIT
jgi:general secretion pathway protein C